VPTSKTSEPHAGRVALATGAARGIGQAIPARLAEHGTRIVLGDNDVSETSDLIGATGHSGGSGDARRQRSVLDSSFARSGHRRTGRVDIAAIKRKYDPQNLFHHNANIQPA
jgi:NAD(P)-dependent dehydrogenase (short-subunit alcohol dehydrogenase family)